MEESRITQILSSDAPQAPPSSSDAEPQLESNPEEESTSEGLPYILSPPASEPESPDPFLVDDLDSSMTSDEEVPPVPPKLSGERSTTASKSEVNLAPSRQAIPGSYRIASPTKSSPPLSPESDEGTEVPEIFLPELILPKMFLPIPDTDPLSVLLTKYITQPEKRPARDLTGDWQRSDFHTLVMTNSWRALAKMARDRLVTSNAADLSAVLALWYLRLSCLSRLRLFNQTSAECTNLFSVLNGIEPARTREYLFNALVPFELEVMYARLRYWAGDHMGYLDALYALFRKCKLTARQSRNDENNKQMWQERGSRICLIIASQLVEMKDYIAAAKILEPLCLQPDASPALRSSVARIYLQGGLVQKAAIHFALVAADPKADDDLKDMNAAMLASAEGDWSLATEKLKGLVARDPEHFEAVNNLSVALLSQGKLKEGIQQLENALRTSPSSVVVAEPFLFNLSTLYELRSTAALDKKRELLIEVAKWGGDGIKTAALKLPPN